MIDVSSTIHLNKFQPRSYQLPIVKAFEEGKLRKLLIVMPRRAGKDIVSFNLCVRQAIRRVCLIYYIFPTYAQGKKVMFDNVTNDGRRFTDFIPHALLESIHQQELKIRLTNGSIIQVVGSDNIDSLMGTNPSLCVFSEYALQSPNAYQFLRPILAANDGRAIFISTPRGKNHFFSLYEVAKNNPEEWFCYKLTLDDTLHIPFAEIEKDRRENIISEDLIQQEYYCSFDLGVEGSYYSRYLDKMRIKGQLTQVPYETGFKVLTCWDLGMRDKTSIIFYQVIGTTVRIIDCYENDGKGLDFYAKILQDKANANGWVYGKHIAPHDIKVRELGTGMSRLERAKQLGISFVIAADLSLEDGIEAVRSNLSKMWIDTTHGALLIKALENYRQELDKRTQQYKGYPLHDWSSHFADAMRYLCISLHKTRDGMAPSDIERMRGEAQGYSQPGMFNDPVMRKDW